MVSYSSQNMSFLATLKIQFIEFMRTWDINPLSYSVVLQKLLNNYSLPLPLQVQVSESWNSFYPQIPAVITCYSLSITNHIQ
jgi:hypothetical protein